MRVVILGYSGLIGHSILKYLLKNTSFNLICVGRNIEKISSYNSRIEYFKWNFSSFTKRNLIFLENADILINCVGKTDENNKDLEYLNFIFLKKIINYIRNQKINLRFIHLSSVAVYGGMKAYFGQFKIITEKTKTIENNLYSLNKLKSDLFIQNLNKKKFNKNFTFTILRISNVFGGEKKSNLFKYVFLSLKIGIWIKSFQKVQFNFVNVNDVAQAVFLVISKLKVSKTKFILFPMIANNRIYIKDTS